MEISRVEERGRPELCREAWAIEEHLNLNSQDVVVYSCSTILGGAIGPSRFNHLSKILQRHFLERAAPGQFAALICPDKSVSTTKFSHKGRKNIEGEVLGFCEEDPNTSRCAISNNQVGGIYIVQENYTVDGSVGLFLIVCRP